MANLRMGSEMPKLIVTDILVPFSFSTPQHRRLHFFLKMTELFFLVLRIHDILVWIRILLFSPLTFKKPRKKVMF
jgi:hypothetical protein